MKASTMLLRVPLGIAISASALGLGLTGTATAAPASASVANDTLTVSGTSDSESIALRLAAGDPDTLQVDFGDDGSADESFDRSTFSKISVLLRAGADQFRVDQVNGAFADEALTVDGGNGDDVLIGGDGAETLDGAGGDDLIDGNRGADVAILGNGEDVFVWDPGDGSDVVEGNSGVDTLDFRGAANAEVFALSANGSSSVFTRNLGNIVMDMDSVEILELTALGGADTMTVNDLKSTDFRRANVDLGGADGSLDTVTVNGTPSGDDIDIEPEDGHIKVAGLDTETHISGAEAADLLQVNTSGGDDDVDIDSEVIGQIDLSFDLGAGN